MNATIQGRSALGLTAPRKKSIRNRTGVIGVTLQIQADSRAKMPKHIRYYVVSPMMRRFNIETLGREEAFRRAVALRAEHERQFQQKKEASHVY